VYPYVFLYSVFATRVEMTSPRWLKQRGHYHWTRFAANTYPKLDVARDDDERVVIPWPKPAPKPATQRMFSFIVF
jgi:hypothetical protein